MMKVKLEKFESTNTNLRTKTVEGECDDLPELKMSFIMQAESLTPGVGMMRLIATSEVTEIVDRSEVHINFKTLNSTYRLNILHEVV